MHKDILEVSKISVAIVVPCYNEEDGLEHLLSAINAERKKLSSYDIDIVLINDGSTDGTQAVIEKMSQKYSFVFFRSFASNAGHQSALRAGINACAEYDAVISMDADMQHPPRLISEMLSSWQDGAQIVQMVRSDSASDAGIGKYSSSKLYYKILNNLSSLNMEYGASDFRLIDQSVAKLVMTSPERNLFLRGYFAWLPVKHATIPYKPDKRFAGASKYTFKKMLKLATSGIMQFSEKPLRYAMNIGIFFALASFLYGISLVIAYLFGSYTVSGWTSLMVVLLFCFGINFILLGIIGRYLAHNIQLAKSRPEYVVVEQKLNAKKEV